MSICNFVFACSIDDSPAYFTYDNIDNMIIIKSKSSCIHEKDDFNHIEPYMGTLISHESIHVAIKKHEGSSISEKLDDLEIIIMRGGQAFQITINNFAFTNDTSGLVLV